MCFCTHAHVYLSLYLFINKNSKQRNQSMNEIYIRLHLNLPGRVLNICNLIGQNDGFFQFFHAVYLQWWPNI